MACFAGITSKFRLYYLAYLAIFFLSISFAVRLVLQAGFSEALPFSAVMLPGLLKGILNDCAALSFVILLPAVLILLPSDRFLLCRAGRIYSFLLLFIFSGIFIVSSAAEYFFWDEFSSRFNFIAVDYLVYTTEVIRNILESYPFFGLLACAVFFALGISVLLWRRLRQFLPDVTTQTENRVFLSKPFYGRLGTLGILYSSALLVFFEFTPFAIEQNRFWNEYAKNGIYELFSAYLNNQLDYRAFYKTMNSGKAFALMKNEIIDAQSFSSSKEESLLRVSVAEGPEKRPNVIVVIMESMGSRRLGENTPHLNSLAEKGLSFSNMMSTGTRTVRGIEAIMLSVPPTPGNSIVRRPDNNQLFTLGTMFRERGYDRDFIYGGLGYFDNMNAFFSGSGYTVTDKPDFSPQNKTFSNAWGQCDEDLYSESLRLADRSFSRARPFHQVLLTTSNHRPFTFPEGKVDRAQGSRRAAIHYADYAIGQFIQKAKEKPWFDNTVFVFIGDHPSSIAGKTEVPPHAYGIACILYGPQFFRPQKVDTLCSQIDIAPTLLASLGWEYPSQFFGINALLLPKEAGRAWISTYQLLGFRTNTHLVVLKPDKSAEVAIISENMQVNQHGELAEGYTAEITDRAVASYQCAYDLFINKKMKESAVMAHSSKVYSADTEDSSSSEKLTAEH